MREAHRKRWTLPLLFFTMAMATAIVWFSTRPCIYVASEGTFLDVVPIDSHTTLSVRFIHSVQKTPVEEFFAVNAAQDGFILQSTRYQSFGVGLPFLTTDGAFRREGDAFVMDGMHRPVPTLDVRPGVGTALTLYINEKEYPLYALVRLGALVKAYIAPRYHQWL